MKIDLSNKLTNTQLVRETRNQPAKKAESASDDVKLSSLSSQLLSPESETTFDAARVSEIKQAIAEGRFTINAGAIADRLIVSAKELLDSRQQA